MDKPEGPTSHDVVALARRAYDTRRVGHGGTLDPFASGLLPLLLGSATRLMPYVVGLRKRYEGTVRLGVRTETDDRLGTVLATSEAWRTVHDDQLLAAMHRLTGRLTQVPPRYSAKKVGGTPAYRRARRGERLTLAPREVEVFQFAPVGREGADVHFEADVGSGTYLRALARDLGDDLGCGAHLLALRRVAVGPWTLRDAAAVARLGALTPPAPPLAAVPLLPRRALDEPELDAVRHGRPIAARGDDPRLVAMVRGDELVAIAEREGDALRPRVVFSA